MATPLTMASAGTADFRLFEATPGISVILLPDAPAYTIAAASNGFIRATGLEKEKLSGKSFLEVLTNKKNIELVMLSFEKLVQTREPQELHLHQYNLIDKTESFSRQFWKIEHVPVFNEQGALHYIIHTATDITAVLKAEQRFQNIIEQAPDPILILMGEELVLAVANHALFELWKVDETAIGKPFLEILPEMKDQVFVNLLKNVLHTGEPFYGYEVPAVFKRRNGIEETRYVNFSYQPYREADGVITGVLVLATDITEQVKAKQKLLENEQNLRNTIVQAPVAMCIIKGPSFVVDIANDRMFELWGKPAEAVMNKPVFEAIPEARHQGLEELLHLVYTTGETFRGNERPVTLNRNGDLETRYINFVYQPYRETDGNISGVISVAIDVTDQVISKRSIEERNEELQMAIEIADLGVFRIDLLEDKAIYSQRIMNWFGFTEQELSLDTIVGHVHPEDREKVTEALQNSYVSEASSSHNVSYRVINSIDGVIRHLHSFGKTYFTESGKPYLMVGMIQDVTAQMIYEQQLKESEEVLQKRVSERTMELESQKNLLNNILENSSNGISVTEMIRDENGNVVDASTILANDAAVKFTGLPREIYLSKTAAELDPGILSSAYGQNCLKTLATGEPSLIQYYLEITGKWLELTISKMDNDHLIHIFTDVTPMKEAQLQLERTIEELRRSNTNLEEFAYAASHDLKEPVRKIHFFSDRLKGSLQGRLNEEEKRTFERMELASKRMGTLIDDLLSYSQVSMLPRSNEAADLNHIISLVLEDLDLEIEEKKARISVGKLFTINGYPRQLQQAFQNLVSNALKYNKPGEAPDISITGTTVKGKDLPVKTESPRKEYYSITIRDNGIGFEQKDVDRIFNVFTRLHGNAEYRGTGVGLSIVRKVIENHNGFITAESTPGSGAVFNIYLPADHDEQ